MKIIELHKSVTSSNDKDAQTLRQRMKEQGCLLINLMSSPGSGKTTLLSKTILDMRSSYQIGVMEADIESDVDAKKIESLGAQSIQVHTDGMCHMDAGMTERGLQELDISSLDVIFLENVGNLICPAEYDTGAGKNIMILSVPEGDDKPLKYPLMFSQCDVLVVTKMDAISYFDFDLNKCIERTKKLNPNIAVFPVSAKTGDGMAEWENWLTHTIESWKL